MASITDLVSQTATQSTEKPEEKPKRSIIELVSQASFGLSPAVESTPDKTLGESQYDVNIRPSNIDSIERIRGANQGALSEATNALMGGIAKIPFTVVGNIASILDFEDYNNKDQEVGNAVTAAMEEIKGNIEEATRIYKSNENTLSSREWWLQSGKGLLDSMGGFVLTGGALGKGVQFLSNLAKGSKILQGVTQTLGTTVNAVMLNQAESIPSAMNVYKSAYDLELNKQLKAGIPQEQAGQLAQEIAADAAAYSISINRINIPLNLTSAFAFLRAPQLTRQLAKDVSKKAIINKTLIEGGQEYIEENVQMVSEKEAIRKAQEGKNYSYNFEKTLDDVLSKEGFETGLIGFLGGALQTAGTDLLGNLQKDAPSYDAKGNVRPETVSRTQSKRERFQAQKNSLDKIEALNKVEGLPTLKETLNKVKTTSNILNDIQIASLQNNTQKVDDLKNQLLVNQSLDAFKNGTTEQLLNTYQSIANDPQSKERLGEDFRVKATEAIKQIKDLEKVYIKHQGLPQVNEAFNNRANYYYNLNKTEALRSEISKAQSEQTRELEITGLQDEKLINNLETTKELNVLKKQLDDNVKNLIDLTKEYQEIISPEYTKKAEQKRVEEKKQEVKEIDQIEQNEEFTVPDESGEIVETIDLNPIEAISTKIVQGQTLTPEEEQFRQNNAEEVENSLKQVKEITEEEPLASQNEQKTVANTRLEETDNYEDVINTQSKSEDFTFRGTREKKKVSINTIEAGPDNGSDESADRYYRFVNNNSPVGLQGMLVTQKNNPKLFSEILESDKAAKQWVLENPKEQGIWMVISKNGKPIKSKDDKVTESGDLIFGTITTVDAILSGRVLNKSQESDEVIIKRLEDFRKVVNDSKEPLFVDITDRSTGHAVFEKTINGTRQLFTVEGRVDNDIKNISLEIPTVSLPDRPGKGLLKNGQIADIGKLYAFNKDNKSVDLIPRLLTEQEQTKVFDLILQKVGAIERQSNNISEQLNKLIYFGIPKTGPTNYTLGQIWSEAGSEKAVIFVGKTKENKDTLSTPEGQQRLKDFLKTKRVNVNTLYGFEDKFTDIWGVTHDSYKDYLLAGGLVDNPLFGTDLVKTSEVQFRNQYYTYDPTIKSGAIKPSETRTKGILKPKERRSLDRLKLLETNTGIPLTKEETDWFKNNFPNIPVEVVKGLIDNKSFGRFLSSGKILLSDEATYGTLYHEAFHAVSQLYLTKKELAELYKETKEKADYRGKPKTNFNTEELLAEDFINYKKTGKILGGRYKRNDLFRKILNFIKDLLNLQSGSIEDIYRRIDKGFYKHKPTIQDVRFSSLDRSAISEEKGVQFEAELLSNFNAIFYEELFKDKKGLTIADVDIKISNGIYNNILDRLEKTFEAEENLDIADNIKYLHDHLDEVFDIWVQKSKSNGIEIKYTEDNKKTDIDNEGEVSEAVDTVNEEENKESNDTAYQEANQVSTKSSMSDDVWTLITSLKQKNKDGSDKLSELTGLPLSINPTTTYNFLLKQCAGLSTYKEIYDKIDTIAYQKPELIDLLEALGEPSTGNSYNKQLLQQQFRQDFGKNRTTSYKTIIEANGKIYVVDANNENNSGRIKEKWQNNIQNRTTPDKEARLILDLDKVQFGNPITFLNSIGFTLSPEAAKQSKEESDFANHVLAIQKYIKQKNGDVTDLFTRKKDEVSVTGDINYLASLEADYNPEAAELSSISIEGKTVYSISYNNAISIIKNIINNSKTKEELFQRLPHLNTISTEGSIYLAELFYDNGNKREDRELLVNLHDGLAADSTSNLDFKMSTRKLTAGDKWVQEINSILLDGRSSYIRASDKSSEHTVNLNKFAKNQKLYIPIKDLKTLDNQKLKDTFQSYFASELKRIALFRIANIGEDLDVFGNTLDKNGKQVGNKGNGFTVFAGILSGETKKAVNEALESLRLQDLSEQEVKQAIDEMAPTFADNVSKDVLDFFSKYTDEIKSDITKNGITKKEGISSEFERYSLDQLVNTVAVNDFINSVEQTKLFIGDMGFYKDLFKRTSAMTGTKMTASNDQFINSWLNTNFTRKDNKVENGEIHTVVFEDVNQSMEQELLDSYINALVDSGISKEEAEKILKAYKSMDEGDAQGWITLDEYRSLLTRLGKKIPQKAFDKAQNGELLTKEEMHYFTVLKTQYAGPQKYNTIFAPAYHKYSLLPLLPSMVKSKNLEKLLDTMTKNQVGYALFKSGSKVGTRLTDGKANSFYTGGNQGIINTKNWTKQTIFYDFLGLQTETSEPKSSVIFGTQFRKLLFSNSFEEGKELSTGTQKLLEQYESIIDGLVKEEKDRLIKELGIDPDTLKSKDISKVIELLQNEAKDRNLSDNLIDGLQSELIEGKLLLKYRFDAMVTKNKIDSMLMSIVKSRLIRQHLTGDALVQVASSGFETEKRKLGTNDALRFYRQEDGKTLPAEVMIPLSKEYKHLLDKYDTLEGVNNAIKDGKISKKALQLIAYRIPTQGLNSMEFFEIKEFLPQESSTSIIVPTAIVAKSGSDFDIDKLNVIKRSNKKAQNDIIDIAIEILSSKENFPTLITPNSSEIIKNVANEVKFIEHLNEKPDPELIRSNFESQEAYQLLYNQKKDTYIKAVEDTLKNNIKYTNQLKLSGKEGKISQFTKFMTAKDMIGIAAIQNTHHVLSQAANLTIDGKQAKINLPHNKLESGDISISKLKDAESKHQISEIISQILTASVDAAKDPFMFDINMTMETLPVALYLIRTGVPFETVGYFLKQPIISEYLNELAINKSGFLKVINKNENKKEIIAKVKGKYFKGAKTTEKEINTKGLVSENQLKSNLNIINQSNREFNIQQLQLLDDYIAYKEQTQLLSDAVRATNMDTSGVGKNLNTIQDKLNLIEQVKKDKFVNGIENILEKSIVKSFNQLEFTKQTFGQFYYTQSPEIVKVKSELLKEINPFGDNAKDKLAVLIENDLINFIIQNYGYPDIKVYKDSLFKTHPVAKRLLDLKLKDNKTDDEQKLANNLLIKELQPLLSSTNRDTNNIRTYTKRYDTFVSDQLTEAFREIKRLNPDLSKEIMDLGILQSGLNNSPITYLGIIPYEYYNDLVKQAFQKFESQSQDKKNGVLDNFQELFLEQNPKGTPKSGWMYGKNYIITQKSKPEHAKPKKTVNIEEEGPQLSKPRINEQLRIDVISKFHSTREQAETAYRQVKNLLLGSYVHQVGDKWKVYAPVQKERSNTFPQQSVKEETSNLPTEQFREIADKLVSKFKGKINYKIVSGEEAVAILNGLGFNVENFSSESAPAFYDNKGNIIFPENYLTSEVAFHEFAHPFVDSIVSENLPLFNNLKRQLQGSEEGKAIIEEVKREYPWLVENGGLIDQGWREAIVTSLGKMADKQLSESKGLISALKTLLKRIGEMLKDVFNISKPIEITAETTLQDLSELLLDENKIDIDIVETKSVELSKKPKTEEEKRSISESAYKKQYIFFKRRISKLEQEKKPLEYKQSFLKEGVEFNKIQEKIDKIQEKINYITSQLEKTTTKTGAKQSYTELGKFTLEALVKYVDALNIGEALTDEKIEFVADILDTFRDFTGLRDTVSEFEEKLAPIIQAHSLKAIQENSTEKEEITQEKVDDQNEDIGKFKLYVGALSDSPNYIARTIGSIIRRAQNRKSVRDKELKNKIETERNLLDSWAKKNGVTLEKAYNLFIQPKKGSTALVQSFYETGNENPNWNIIQSTPELKRFYEFYQKTISELQQKQAINLGKNFIPNVKSETTWDKVKNLVPVHETKKDEFSGTEDLYADILPQEYTNRIVESEKSRDLSAILMTFGKHTNNHEEMSDILPKVRILQRTLHYKINEAGDVVKREFKKSSDPKNSVLGEDSNLNKMVEGYINMQIFSEMKEPELKVNIGDVHDEKGNIVGKKYILGSDVFDVALKYNSLLRIGFAPITAGANWLFGDISNLIEGFGARFFTNKGLIQASNIYAKQTFDENSVLNKTIIEELNVLQDLEDYNQVTDVSLKEVKRLSPEKLKEYAYSMQKTGEKWLQTRTAMAVMIKDDYLSPNGELTDKYNKTSERERTALVDKIQRLNQMIHGRYTQQEAAILQQQVWYRIASQFKKWLPAAIEARFGDKQYDNRLQVEMEGRYKTFGKMLWNLGDTYNRLKDGKLTELEIYNSKKMLVEITLLGATLLGYLALGGDDDEKRRQNWAVKTGLTLLNRVSGDISYFYSPAQLAHTAKNAVPLIKTFDDLRLAISYIPVAFDEEKGFYQRGSRKGQSKVLSKLGNITIGVKPVLDIARLLNKSELEELK